MGIKEQAISKFKGFVAKHPEHRDKAYDFLQLMFDEIESGESEDNEFALFLGSLDELISEVIKEP